ncbi:MAG: phosphodiester glycosidase family protein, partial [Clostridia bacterium]|nr:phosphodiester glycosidase family protein [Clostridia bacterium]
TGMAKDSSLGWIYLKKGKYDTSYTGMAKNQYGWWYIRNGKLDQTYVGLAKNQYGWWYLVNGAINKSYNSLARNDYGWWYIKNGTINKYNGTFTNNMGTWSVKNGKATITKKNFSSITNYEVDTKSVTTKIGSVIRAWRIQQTGLYIEIHRVKYGNQITQKFLHSQDSQVNIEKTITYQPYVNIAIMTVTDPTRMGIASAKSILGANTAYVEDMAKKNGAVIAINNEATTYSNDHTTVRNGQIEKSSTAVSKTKYLHIYRDGSWQFKAMDNANIGAEIKNGLYNTIRTQQTFMISGGKEVSTPRDQTENGIIYYNNRTLLGRISNTKTVFAVGEFMPISNIDKVMIAYGVTDAVLLNGGNCSSMYVKGVGNTTGAIGKSLKDLNKINVLETEFFGNNHMIGNNSQGYEMLGGACKEPDMIYFK